MMDDQAVKFFATMIQHRDRVNQNLQFIMDELDRRGTEHDLSKFNEDEVEGFIEINEIAREYDYGTEEYEQSMENHKGEDGCIGKHYSRNRHHPDHHDEHVDMNWLDIIEMVCDWKSASDSYNNGSFLESVNEHKDKYDFSDEQKWLIDQVAYFLLDDNDGN